MQCQQLTKKDGKQCNAQAIRGKKYCFTHHPGYKKQRQVAHRNGGLARRHYQVYLDEPIKLNSPKDVQQLLEVTLNSILRGKMPANNPGNTVGFLSRCWLDAYEKGELVERIDRLEGLVKKAINEN
jgi:hypothetical protein